MNYISQASHGVPDIPSIPAMYVKCIDGMLCNLPCILCMNIFHIQCGIPYTSAGERPDILKGFGNYEVTY